MKTPTHYVFFFKKRVQKDGDLKGMKSHDFHVMMQDILPLCIKHLMAKGCIMVINYLNHMFEKLCAKIVDPKKMFDFKSDVIVTLLLLEKEFPPFFWYHEELEICGPIHTCWMYLVERYMKTLKGYARNKARLEGSMA